MQYRHGSNPSSADCRVADRTAKSRLMFRLDHLVPAKREKKNEPAMRPAARFTRASRPQSSTLRQICDIISNNNRARFKLENSPDYDAAVIFSNASYSDIPAEG